MFDRRVTFDRAVWTKPLASAADAAPQLCPFKRTSHECAGGSCGADGWSVAIGDGEYGRDGGVVGVEVGAGQTSGARPYERDTRAPGGTSRAATTCHGGDRRAVPQGGVVVR
jgi:hypothetical protein